MSETDDNNRQFGKKIECTERFGNIIKVEYSDGKKERVAASTQNQILFEDEIISLFSNSQLTITHDPYIAIRYLSDSEYMIYYLSDSNNYHVSGNKSVELLTALKRYSKQNETRPIEQFCVKISNERPRVNIINDIPYNVDIIPTQEGWIIEDMFYLKWNQNIHPFTGDYQNPSNWEDNQSLFSIVFRESASEMNLSFKKSELTDNEIDFLRTAAWLVNYPNKLYKSFWNNYRRAIDRESKPGSKQGQDVERFFDDPGPVMTDTSYKSKGIDINTQSMESNINNNTWDIINEKHKDSYILSYQSHTSRESHGHSPNEHDGKEVFNLTDELISDYLHFSPMDHAVLHEMIRRKHELINADVEVFADVEDSRPERWRRIDRQRQNAHINHLAENYLESQFGNTVISNSP